MTHWSNLLTPLRVMEALWGDVMTQWSDLLAHLRDMEALWEPVMTQWCDLLANLRDMEAIWEDVMAHQEIRWLTCRRAVAHWGYFVAHFAELGQMYV